MKTFLSKIFNRQSTTIDHQPPVSNLPFLLALTTSTLAILLFTIFVPKSSKPTIKPLEMSLVDSIMITGQTEIIAGESYKLYIGPVKTTVGGLVPNGTIAITTLLGGIQHSIYNIELINGRAELEIPADKMQVAGHYLFTIDVGNASETHSMHVRPGQSISPVYILANPRRIPTDRQERTMLVAVPTDQYGNTMPSGRTFTYTARLADGSYQTLSTPVRHQIAWTWLSVGEKAGRGAVAGRIGDSQGPAIDLNESPGDPRDILLQADPIEMTADEVSISIVQAGPLRDSVGNQVADGTLVQFIIEGPRQARRLLMAQSVNGLAEVGLPAADSPGQATIWAMVLNQVSQPITITYTPGPAVEAIPLQIESFDWQQELTLAAGPIIGPLGEFVADGTSVRFEIVNPNSRISRYEAIIFAGYSRLQLRTIDLEPGCYVFTAKIGEARGQIMQALPDGPDNGANCLEVMSR